MSQTRNDRHLPLTQTRTQYLEQAFLMFQAAQYGTWFSHNAVLDTLRLQARTRAYYALIDTVRERLQSEAQRTLVNELNTGYRVAFPREHADLAERGREGQIRKGEKIIAMLQSANVSLLTNAEFRRHDEKTVSARHHLAVLKGIAHAMARHHRKQAQQNQDLENKVLAELALAEARVREKFHPKGGPRARASTDRQVEA